MRLLLLLDLRLVLRLPRRRGFVHEVHAAVALCLLGQTQIGLRQLFVFRFPEWIGFGSRQRSQVARL